jgi:hypothetical protein
LRKAPCGVSSPADKAAKWHRAPMVLATTAQGLLCSVDAGTT